MAGVPSYLKGKEFIFRNATHLHVSEFQKVVVGHLKAIVEDGVEVKVLQDVTQAAKGGIAEDPKCAYITMNSVKLLMESNSSSAVGSPNSSHIKSRLRPRSARFSNSNKGDMSTEVLNQVSAFTYSVPFTLDASGKAHAKNIDEQWMRTTTLTVKEPFPFVLTRQLVQSRKTQEFTPIEVSINDIRERVDDMMQELDKPIKNSADNNNLMRLVQGTVLPQVKIVTSHIKLIHMSALFDG